MEQMFFEELTVPILLVIRTGPLLAPQGGPVGTDWVYQGWVRLRRLGLPRMKESSQIAPDCHGLVCQRMSSIASVAGFQVIRRVRKPIKIKLLVLSRELKWRRTRSTRLYKSSSGSLKPDRFVFVLFSVFHICLKNDLSAFIFPLLQAHRFIPLI